MTTHTEITKRLIQAEELNGAVSAEAALDAVIEKRRINQERKLEYIKSKIAKKDIPQFATFAKNQSGKIDPVLVGLANPSDVINRLVEVAAQQIIPAGFSLVDLVKEFNKYFHKNAKGESGVSKMGAVEAEEESSEEDDKKKNKTAGEGVILCQIGATIDASRTFTPTAINNILEKLTVDGGKLDTLRVTLLDYIKCGSGDVPATLKTFDMELRRAVVAAAGRYVDCFEQARGMDPEGNVVSLENLCKVLDEKKLRDSMSDEDKTRENMFLQLLVNYSNDIEAADDDKWKDIVMEMLSVDLLESPVIATREHLNIVKSFQNLVAEIMKPAPRRGRPPKVKN